MEAVERELRALRAMVEQLVERLDARSTQLFSRKEAALRLGIGMSTLKTMIASGEIVELERPGRHPKIPLAEIDRLCTRTEVPRAKRRGGGRPPAAQKSVAEMASNVRAELRKRRAR